MQYSKEDFENLRKKQTKKPEENVAHLEMVRAAPQMQVLTNSLEWDKYLSYLEPVAVQAEQTAKDIQNQLVSPTLFDAEKIFYLKSEFIRMTERAEVIRTLISIPKEIIAFGKIKSNPFKDKT